MNPRPLLTKSSSAVFWAADSGSSPVVSANITTSYASRCSVESIARSSVVFSENSPLVAARLAIAWRAAEIESCLNAAVVVSINTRTGIGPEVGPDGWVTDVGADNSLDEQATAQSTMMSGAQRAPRTITARGPCA